MSKNSSSEHGTMYQIRNLIGRTNVVSQPKRDLNACEDFFGLVLDSYVTSAVMEVLGITSLDEWPADISENLWLEDETKRRGVMQSILSKLIDGFLNIQFNQPPQTNRNESDQVLMYFQQILSIGSLYMEFADAIKEGDGERVLRCWRYFLVIFHTSNRRNYAKEVFHLLYQYQYVLSPQQKEPLLYNRFINTTGTVGRNISDDLHMEHLNRELKECIALLRSNKHEHAIIRVGKAMGTISPVLQQFDQINEINLHKTNHTRSSIKQDMTRIINDIGQYRLFKYSKNRKYLSFPNPKSLLHESELLKWIKTHIPTR